MHVSIQKMKTENALQRRACEPDALSYAGSLRSSASCWVSLPEEHDSDPLPTSCFLLLELGSGVPVQEDAPRGKGGCGTLLCR